MTNLKTLSLALALACVAHAQDDKPDAAQDPEKRNSEQPIPEKKGPQRSDRRRGGDKILETIDVNKDGTISAEEIKGSSKALLKLDKDKSGSLSREECAGRKSGLSSWAETRIGRPAGR